VHRILIRATNWVGDAVMSLPAIRVIRERFPAAHIAVLARPWVADLYAREPAIDRVIRYEIGRWPTARMLSRDGFDTAILLPNSFDAALLAWLARIPQRIGYRRDGRGLLLTDAIPVPKTGETPRHERYYYLELLRRAGIIDAIPNVDTVRLGGADAAGAAGARRLRDVGLTGDVIGVSPGAAYGNAKRWLPERFAETAVRLGNHIALFGSAGERALCDTVGVLASDSGARVYNFAGETTLAQFIELAAACRLFVSNDSGAMHIASALGVPTVTVFGSTDHTTTGPTGPLARIVREPVECSPCLLRECPIDHRCMTRVTVERVVQTAQELRKETTA
jgi:heptosyltransferase-2